MRYLTVLEVGQVLERGPETVAEWLADGRLPSWRMQGRLVVPRVALWPVRQVHEGRVTGFSAGAGGFWRTSRGARHQRRGSSLGLTAWEWGLWG
jgi:excisionase family DNA binding protein